MTVKFEASLPIRPAEDPLRAGRATLEIGLVNNMPDSAVAATERQFTRLLRDAAGDLDVRPRFYALASVPRSAAAKEAMRGAYRSVDDLRGDAPDGLIITGAGPVTPELSDEPYWRELVDLFDFARGGAHSTIFSCLAAHAAVLHWDGVARRRLKRKLSGVYAARVVAKHPLVEGFPDTLAAPHSRYNDLDEATLTAKGYRTLRRSDVAGVDAFVKDEASLLVFLQGHPEYDADSLAKEYRRDHRRFLSGELATPPDPPDYAFPVEARSGEPDWALIDGARESPWRSDSARLYRNWLRIIADRKAAATSSSVGALGNEDRAAR
jgi:homoserine O-succinyltransferase